MPALESFVIGVQRNKDGSSFHSQILEVAGEEEEKGAIAYKYLHILHKKPMEITSGKNRDIP